MTRKKTQFTSTQSKCSIHFRRKSTCCLLPILTYKQYQEISNALYATNKNLKEFGICNVI